MYYVISVVQVLVQDLISVIKALMCLLVIAMHKGKGVHICKSICTYVTLLVTFVKKSMQILFQTMYLYCCHIDLVKLFNHVWVGM